MNCGLIGLGKNLQESRFADVNNYYKIVVANRVSFLRSIINSIL